MISSPSAQIVNTIAEERLITRHGKKVPSYGPVMGVATAIIAIGIAVTAALGPEKKGRKFEEALPAGANYQMAKEKDLELGDQLDKATAPVHVEVTKGDSRV